METINRDPSSEAVHTVPCSTADVSNSDYVRIITTRGETSGHQDWAVPADETAGLAGAPRAKELGGRNSMGRQRIWHGVRP